MGKRAVCLLACLAVLGSVGVAFGELVGHWKLDEGQGTKIADSSGKGNKGSVTAGGTGTIYVDDLQLIKAVK